MALVLVVVLATPAVAFEPPPPSMDTFGSRGSEPAQFEAPFGISTDAVGNWYVADSGNDRIQVFNSNGDFMDEFGGSGTGPGEFDEPNGIEVFFDPGAGVERLLVADSKNNRLQVLELSGTHVSSVSMIPAATPATLDSPAGVRVGPEGDVFVSDRQNNRVLILDDAFNLVHEIEGGGPGPITNPTGLALSPDGSELYVAEAGANRVRVYDTASGAYLAKWGDAGPLDTRVSAPYGLVTDSIGFVYVPNASSVSVMKFTPRGTHIWSLAMAGSLPGQLGPPYHSAVTGDGRLAVTEYGNHRVQVFDLCPGGFVDVPESHPFFFEICWMDSAQVSTGYADGTYRPNGTVTRQAMSAFLHRMADGLVFTPPPVPTFSDVPTSHPFYLEIEWMASEGITGGFPDGTYRPNEPVSRQAMSAFMYRSAGEPAFVPPVVPTFLDVATPHRFFAEIEWMADAGVSEGFSDSTYRPLEPVTRQAMSAFLARLTLIT